MFLALDQAALSESSPLRRSMFAHRAGQFVERHGWPLRLDAEGLEVDEYDDRAATYCLVEQGGRHVASVRLRPAETGCMVEDHFPELWLRGRGLRKGIEITRFCAAPGLAPDDRLTAVSDLLLGLCRHCQRTGIASIFGVVFPPVARVIRQAGWTGAVLNETGSADGRLLLMQWTPAETVAWAIQERRELREEIWARRREGLPMAMVA
ncbi:MAG: acyl-homoserine-lactone synthase [Amaricoccus sp.]